MSNSAFYGIRLILNTNKVEAPAPVAEQTPEELIGKEVTIDNRKYVIESIGNISGDVSMRDITFENHAGFPINRVEKLHRVHEWLKAQEQAGNRQYIYVWQ